MTKPIIMMSTLAIAVSCGAHASEHQDLMSLIESKVQLPEGAEPIGDYSRNYALMPNGSILAVYIIPPEPIATTALEEGCEVVLEDFETRPCSAEEITEIRQQDAAMAENSGKAGQSRWWDDYSEMPGMSDGGCMQISISFDPRSQEIESVECNGSV